MLYGPRALLLVVVLLAGNAPLALSQEDDAKLNGEGECVHVDGCVDGMCMCMCVVEFLVWCVVWGVRGKVLAWLDCLHTHCPISYTK